MKKWVTLVAAFLMAVTGQAVILTEGTQEIEVSGFYDPEAADDYEYDLTLGYGRFLIDNFELGVRGTVSGSDHVTLYGIQGLAEYNFPVAERVSLFVQGTVGWLGGEVKDRVTGDKESNDTAAASVAGGAKYFITDTVALSLDVEYTKATDDIFANDDDLEDDNVDFNLALRFYIP
jgi:opacity protein-like surface antigen